MRIWRRRDGKLFYQPSLSNGESLHYNRHDPRGEMWLDIDHEDWRPVRYRSKRKAERVERDRETPVWTEVK